MTDDLARQNELCAAYGGRVYRGAISETWAERFARDLEAGTIYQNRCDYLDPALPWTGYKESGLGSTLSRHGFLHLTRRKSVHFRLKTPK